MSKKEKIYMFIKILLVVFILISLIRAIIINNFTMILVSLISLIIFCLPYLFGKIFHVKFPIFLNLIICVFVFLSQILGDVYDFYLLFPWWDDFLHFTSGIMIIEIAYFFMNIINQNNNKIYLTPLYKVAVSFCFTISILAFWECFEFSCDKFLGTDTQKDTIVNKINSSEFTKNNKYANRTIEMNSIIINNNDWIESYGGYIDIGLNDTMYDLLNGIGGAIIYSFVRYKFLKSKNIN